MDTEGNETVQADGGEWVTIAEAARRVNRSAKTIRRGVTSGILVAQRSGPGSRSPWLVRADSLSHYGTVAAAVAEPPPLVLAADYRQREAELVDRLIGAETRAAKAETVAEHLRERLDEARVRTEELERRLQPPGVAETAELETGNQPIGMSRKELRRERRRRRRGR